MISDNFGEIDVSTCEKAEEFLRDYNLIAGFYYKDEDDAWLNGHPELKSYIGRDYGGYNTYHPEALTLMTRKDDLPFIMIAISWGDEEAEECFIIVEAKNKN